MGSQNVTNFSASRTRRIQAGIRAWASAEPDTAQKALLGAAAAAVGSLTPQSNFTQALTSASFETAVQQLISLARDVKRARSAEKVDEILQGRHVRSTNTRPLGALSAGLQREVAAELNKTQRNTNPGVVVGGALHRTLVETVEKRLPGREDVLGASREDVVRALRKTPEWELTRRLAENTAAALLERGVDVARGPFGPRQVQPYKRQVRLEFAPQLIGAIFPKPAERKKQAPERIADHFRKKKVLAKGNKKVAQWKEEGPVVHNDNGN